MTKTIFKSVFAVGISVMLLCAVLFFGLQYRETYDETYAALQQEAVYAENGLKIGGMHYLETLGSINRITWIAEDGSVRYDSECAGETANQAGYPEVRDAFSSGEGKGIRKSESIGESMMYYALRCGDGSVLRLSRPLSAVRTAAAAVSPVLWVTVLVLMISGVLAFRAAKQITQPINALDLDNPDPNIYSELAPLVSRIQVQNFTIQEQIVELKRRQEEFSALTASMSEGFLLVDRDAVVLSVTGTAQRLLSVVEIGDKLDPSGEVREAVKTALHGEHAETMFTQDGEAWEFIANPVQIHGKPSGAVLLLVNVTEREQREQLRQEFSANVSHELKTPLTSISGFAELMAQGMVPQEKTEEFASDIYREAQRLIALVDDIIRLSKLDEGGLQMQWEPVELKALSADVLETLRAAAEKRKVRMELIGEPVAVDGVYRLLHETVYNLCDNAVKYNREGGSVTVSVSETAAGVTLTVTDTGIGIPYAEQGRVFERFYRVDKSHSKELGGTGLGLSIVKHAAQYLGASVTLDSTPGEGTAITLTFPQRTQQKGDGGHRK